MQSRVKNIADNFLNAILKNKVNETEQIICEDCKIHLDLFDNREIHLGSKKEVLDYLKAHISHFMCDEIIDKKCIATDKNHAVLNFKAKWNISKHIYKLNRYCLYYEIKTDKIKELYIIAK